MLVSSGVVPFSAVVCVAREARLRVLRSAVGKPTELACPGHGRDATDPDAHGLTTPIERLPTAAGAQRLENESGEHRDRGDDDDPPP